MNKQQAEKLLKDIDNIRSEVNYLYWLSKCAVFMFFFSHLLKYGFENFFSFFFLAYIVLIIVEVCANALLFFADKH